MAAVLVLLLLCAVLGLLLLWNRNKNMKLPPLAEGALPIIGHGLMAFLSSKNLYTYLIDTTVGASIKKGHDAVVIRFGTIELFAIMNPEDAYVVANSCLKKEPLYRFFKPLIGDAGLITADVPVWKKHRKLLNPTFNQSVLDTYLAEFNDQSRRLITDLSHEVGRGSFDQLPYVKHVMLQLVCATIMGVDVKEKAIIEKAGEAFVLFTKCMRKRTQKFWYHNDTLYTFSNLKKEQYAAAKTFQELSYEVFRKKKEYIVENKDSISNQCKEPLKSRYKSFFDLVLELSNNETLTESEIVEEVNTFIGAAFDTTYQTVGITLLTLGSYPEVQQKVFEELQEVFDSTNRDVERKDISKLKYMEAVIKETMRLYPVVFLIGRTLDMNLNLKNYILPTGSRCFVSVYHVNRHSSWGPDADVFRPERWLDGSLATNTIKAFASFGLGRRSCIGSTYAMMSMKTVLAHVLRRYQISGDVTQLVLSADVVVTPLSGHHISVERRENSNGQ